MISTKKKDDVKDSIQITVPDLPHSLLRNADSSAMFFNL